jgi:hypothetical protein
MRGQELNPGFRLSRAIDRCAPANALFIAALAQDLCWVDIQHYAFACVA